MAIRKCVYSCEYVGYPLLYIKELLFSIQREKFPAISIDELFSYICITSLMKQIIRHNQLMNCS